MKDKQNAKVSEEKIKETYERPELEKKGRLKEITATPQ